MYQNHILRQFEKSGMVIWVYLLLERGLYVGLLDDYVMINITQLSSIGTTLHRRNLEIPFFL